MLNRRQKIVFLKLLSLFSVVRGYNILIITLAQYLAAIFILAHDWPLSKVVLDSNLFMIVTASSLAIAGGYIINNFYDAEKDTINRPIKSMIDRLVSQNTKLTGYFILNFLSVIAASYVSFRAVVFFSLYIFGIWLYSHKLKKWPLIGNMVSAILSITPFFAVFIYYKNFETVIFVHAIFLFLLILMREFVKDLEGLKGDLALNYKTIPVLYGERVSKWIITLCVLLTAVPVYFLIFNFQIGLMDYYFYGAMGLLSLFILLLWQSNSQARYLLLHNILKLILVMGVFSILLLDLSLVKGRWFW
ncbi:geranylgeranylglycerol-phosphate geranylgeranyltransferase [Imtechella halotolerans]|uniref:geranylgeranylglycerol-phosphate geranylgeranyltransferase n=1 Tax=Imtechella halotolerans TaxID=1165090 RepID=UPI000302C15E|nr:geranylgeranylglycerol-phosphate geranylgeranyltransferase [Imtechella halotolerans]WMQ62627.1 geranylgeranylglycerol-phosphate geranylgeranyltransferase [Imtechella halotolerans]